MRNEPLEAPSRRLRCSHDAPDVCAVQRPGVAARLKAEAAARHASASSLAEELIDEGLRVRRHPLVCFRDGPTGRRAALIGGPDVWEVVSGIVGGDVPAADRMGRATELFALRPEQVEAVLGYYAEFTQEVDAEIKANALAAAEAEELWRRGHDLLGS